MLHIHNGEASADVLKQSGVTGEQLVWREALVGGPTPGCGVSGLEWREIRSAHLAEAYGVPVEECLRDLTLQQQALEACLAHDEVVLWFEHDLFCQTLLIYLLDWFARQDLTQTRLSLICTNDFPGVPDFRGLGQLSPAQLASLFPTRHQVTTSELTLGARAWAAYSADNPTEIERLLETDTTALPYLEDALRLHLARFPSVRNGLGRVENKALDLINAGHSQFASVFTAFGSDEPVYGFGDAQFYNDLRRLANAENALLVTDTLSSSKPTSAAITDMTSSSFRLTDTGRAVASGAQDFLDINTIDYWLGGVHLDTSPSGTWRWNEQDQKLESRG